MIARNLLRHYQTSHPFHCAVPVRYFATDEVFVTRQGDCGLALSFTGIDDERLTLERLESVSHTLVAAFRLFDERFRLYQYLIKTGLPDLPRKESYASATFEQIAQERALFLNGRLSRMELYLVILYEPSVIRRQHGGSNKDRSEGIDRLSAVAQSFQHSVGDLFAPRILKQQEIFRFLRFLLNLDWQKAGV